MASTASLATGRWPVLSDLPARVLPRRLVAAVAVVAGAGLTAVCAQVAVYLPHNPVPITGQTFGVLVVGAALGPVLAVASMTLYALLALAGLPVLAPNAGGGHTTGTAVLHLPTFGYLVGFVVAGALLGAAARRGLDRRPWWTALSFLVGSAVIYLFGVTWLTVDLHLTLSQGVALGMRPFLLGDLIKALLAAAVLPGAWWVARRLD